jgi:hypothetical protein
MLPLQEQKAAEKHAGGKAKRSKSEVQAPALEEQVPNDSDDDEVQESDEVEQGMAEVDNVADQDEDSEDERDEEMMGNEEIGANERLLFKEVQRLQRELDEANAETSRAQQARANAEMRLNEAKKTIKTKKKVQFAPQTPAPAPTSGPTASFPVESLADLMRQMTAANEAKEKRDNKSKGLKNFAFAWLAGIDKTKVDVTTRAFVALLELASTADHSCVGLSPDLIIQALGQNKVMHRDDAMWQALSPELMAKSSTEPLHDEFSVAEFLRGALAAKIQTARESASGLLSAKSLAEILPDLATLLRLAATPSVAVGRLRHAGTLLGFAGENEIASFSQFLRSKTVRSALEQEHGVACSDRYEMVLHTRIPFATDIEGVRAAAERAETEYKRWTDEQKAVAAMPASKLKRGTASVVAVMAAAPSEREPYKRKDASRLQCFRCRKVGHIASECRTNWDVIERESAAAASATTKVKATEKSTHYVDLFAVSRRAGHCNPRQFRALIVDVAVNRANERTAPRSTTALLDSGAQVSGVDGPYKKAQRMQRSALRFLVKIVHFGQKGAFSRQKSAARRFFFCCAALFCLRNQKSAARRQKSAATDQKAQRGEKKRKRSGNTRFLFGQPRFFEI